MASRLLNVRLDEERARKARTLRENGFLLSDVVREAIDEKYERVKRRPRTARDVEKIMRAIYERHPTPPDAPSRGYDITDREAVRAAIVKELRHEFE